MFYRANPKGIYYERWVHTHGCKKWFNAVRNTSTDEILKVYKMGETPPPLKEFKNTIKTPSGEPDVGSGNFSVKNHEKNYNFFLITFFSSLFSEKYKRRKI